MLMSDGQHLQTKKGSSTGDDRPSGYLAVRPRRPGQDRCGALTHQGQGPDQNNEDISSSPAWPSRCRSARPACRDSGETRFSDEDGYLMMVADGMGGRRCGRAGQRPGRRERRGLHALNTLKWFFHIGKAESGPSSRNSGRALELADKAVVEEGEANARFYGMGTTLTMAYSVGADLYIVHAGDSRAYLSSAMGSSSRSPATTPWSNSWFRAGVLTPEDAKTTLAGTSSPTSSAAPALGVHAEIHKVRIEDGDVLLALLRWPDRAGRGRPDRRDPETRTPTPTRNPPPGDSIAWRWRMAAPTTSPPSSPAIRSRITEVSERIDASIVRPTLIGRTSTSPRRREGHLGPVGWNSPGRPDRVVSRAQLLSRVESKPRFELTEPEGARGRIGKVPKIRWERIPKTMYLDDGALAPPSPDRRSDRCPASHRPDHRIDRRPMARRSREEACARGSLRVASAGRGSYGRPSSCVCLAMPSIACPISRRRPMLTGRPPRADLDCRTASTLVVLCRRAETELACRVRTAGHGSATRSTPSS